MPIVIDEVLITVEVDNAGTAGAGSGGAVAGRPAAGGAALAGGDKQALVAECVERVLEILAERREP